MGFLSSLIASLSQPIMPSYISALTGLNLAEANSRATDIFITWMLLQIVAVPLLGYLGDIYGRRRIIILSCVIQAIETFVFWHASSINELLIAKIVSGCLMGGGTLLYVILMDLDTSKHGTKNFGMMGAMTAAGVVIGPAVGGWLGDINLRFPFAIAFIGNIIYLLIALAVLANDTNTNRKLPNIKNLLPKNFFDVVKVPSSAAGLRLYLILHFTMCTLTSIWPVYAAAKFNWSLNQIGLSMAYAAICGIFFQGVILGKLVGKIGELAVGITSFLVISIVYICISFSNNPWLFGIYIPLYMFARFGEYATIALVAKNTSKEHQGRLMGLLGSLSSISMIIASLVASRVFEHYSCQPNHSCFLGAPFLLTVFISACAFLFWWLFDKKKIEH